MKLTAITLAALLALTACDNSGGNSDARLDAIETALAANAAADTAANDAILEQLTGIQANIGTNGDAGIDAVLEELGNVQANLATLTMAAAEIRGEVNRPITPSNVSIGDWSGLIVYTRAGTNVWIQPGACDTPAEPVQVPAGETLMGTFHQAPTGPHCLSASEASPVGVTIDVQPGTIASVILPPDEFEVVE